MKLERIILILLLQENRCTERKFVYKMWHLFFGKIKFK